MYSLVDPITRGEGDYLYTFKPANYAKNCVAVHCPPRGEGFFSKSMAGTLAECVRARYSNRERAYIMRQSQFKRFEKLCAEKARGNVFTREIEKEN